MATIIEVETDSLEEAREHVKSQMHKGLQVLSENVISDGKPRAMKAVAESIEIAFAKAQGDVPNDAVIVERRELAAPGQKAIIIEAFDESSARAQIESQSGITIKALRLATSGKQGFLGIGKKPNQYEAEIIQQAVVEVIYKKKAKIRTEIGVRLITPNRISPTDSFAQEIWNLTDGPLGKLEKEGMTVDISLYLYGHAQLNELKSQIQAARQVRAGINTVDAADKLFLGGLYVIAGDMKIMGKEWVEFKPVCHFVTTMYTQKLKPIAGFINSGRRPSDSIPEIGFFRNTQLNDLVLSARISEAMSPLVLFLNDERSRI